MTAQEDQPIIGSFSPPVEEEEEQEEGEKELWEMYKEERTKRERAKEWLCNTIHYSKPNIPYCHLSAPILDINPKKGISTAQAIYISLVAMAFDDDRNRANAIVETLKEYSTGYSTVIDKIVEMFSSSSVSAGYLQFWLDTQTAVNETLREENKECEKRFLECQKTIGDLLDTNTTLHAQIGLKELENKELLDTLEEKNKHLRTVLEDKNKQINEMEGFNRSINEHYQKVIKELEELKKRNEELNDENYRLWMEPTRLQGIVPKNPEERKIIIEELEQKIIELRRGHKELIKGRVLS